MPPDAAVSFTDALRSFHLLEPAQLDELNRELQARFPEARALAGELIRRGWLSPYQVNQLMRGRGHELLLGSYVLVERLGEGGMGQVFKARNWKLGRVVALKLIRKDRLEDGEAVRRFHREIRAAAQLDHPNIVRAFDADEIGGTHLLVMEYVQGVDLAKNFVKRDGPLPVDRACDYARQAALGLQHAFERGMVHRDVKPQNLLRTPDGVVKILNMGLARLGQAAEAGEGTSTMTQEGAVMGTLNYIAPEQAMDSHTVDIRADLYSLGCTLYFLLTGRVPFPGGTAMEKLVKHQSKEPVPVEQVRPGVPVAVGQVVRKLMAKRPAARFQTPAEAAHALATVPMQMPAAAASAGEATVAEGLHFGAAETTPQPAQEPTVDMQPTAADRPGAAEQRRRAARRRSLILYAAGGLLSLALAGLFLALLLHVVSAPAPSAPPAAADTKPAVAGPPATFDQWLKDVAALPAERQAEAVAFKLRERNPGFDGPATPTVENGVVTGLTFQADEVRDLAPLQALRGLQHLTCQGTGRDRCKLNDLTPLKGLELISLDCRGTAVANLTPLGAMPLTKLDCAWTRVTDLAPLRRAPLKVLDCGGAVVSDLTPLRETPLTSFGCFQSHVTDLSPVLKPPLTALWCNFSPRRDEERLRSVATLTLINGKAAGQFWKEVREFAATVVGKGGEYAYVAGADADAFQKWVDQAAATGYRPFFVNGRDADGSPEFTALAVNDPGGPSWDVRSDLTSAEYQKKFEELVGAGYYPFHASGYLSGGVVRFVAVWVIRPAPWLWEAHHFMTPAVYQTTTATLRASGMRPTYVSAFADAAGSHFFAAQFVDVGDTPGVAVQDLTAEQYRQAIDRRQAEGYRPDQVSAYDALDGPRFAAVFVKDGAGWTARDGLSAAGLRAEMEKQAGDGLWPTSVVAYRDGGATRYAAVWSNKNNP